MGSTSSVDDDFDAATSCVGSLAASGELTDDDLLRFYGLFKQATEGTCDIPKPPFFDLKGRAKWAAWQAIGDISSHAARAAYIDLLTSLKPEWDAKPAKTSGGAGGGVFSSLAHDDADDNEEEGTTPLIAAASEGNVKLLRMLLAEGALPDQRDAEGCSALHWAADRGHPTLIADLVAAGADINGIDSDGQTPLHYAALAEQQGAARALLQAGADREKRNCDGETAQDIASAEWEKSVFNT